MTPGDNEREETPRDPMVAAGESAPASGVFIDSQPPPVEMNASANKTPERVGGIGERVGSVVPADEGVPPSIGASSVDTHDDQVNAGENKLPPKAPAEFGAVAKADDETVDESVAHEPEEDDQAEGLTSLVDDAPDAAEAGEAKPKPKRRRKKAEEPPGLPKVAEELMYWYVLKVQSNREDSTADAIKRRLKIAAVDPHVGEVVVPTEKVLEIKDGKKTGREAKVLSRLHHAADGAHRRRLVRHPRHSRRRPLPWRRGEAPADDRSRRRTDAWANRFGGSRIDR